MHRLVEHSKCAAARLRPFGFGNAIAREQFVRKAHAVGVYQNGAVATDIFGQQRCGGLLDGWMYLNLVDVNGVGADLLGKLDAVALRTGLIRGYGITQLGTILSKHLAVRSEAARCHDKCAASIFDGQLVRVGGAHAGNLSVLHEDFLDLGVAHGRYTALAAYRQEKS